MLGGLGFKAYSFGSRVPGSRASGSGSRFGA